MSNSMLNKLKSTLSMGARANKYRVMVDGKGGGPSGESIDTLCKGGAIPAKTMGTIDIWTQGRKLPVAGDAQFENTWTLTFYQTQGHELRSQFDAWMNFEDDFDKHSRGASSHNDYMSDGCKIIQLNTSDNSPTAEYTFYNMFPTSIAAVDLADESADTIEEFTVDFSYSHWVRTA